MYWISTCSSAPTASPSAAPRLVFVSAEYFVMHVPLFCCGTAATVFPHLVVPCCWSWVGLLEGQYGTGAGGLCWQARRSDPWLGSFFRAAVLAVGTGRNSRRMLECRNRLCWCYICHINILWAVCVYARQAPLLVLFVYIHSGNDLNVYILAHMHAWAFASWLCADASGCSLQLSVFIYSCSQCAPGTAAQRPASPEAKECPLFLLLSLLLTALLSLLAHALSGAAGTSAQPGPSRPAGHVGLLNPSTLTWTWTRSGSWERIHNRNMLRPGARKSRGSVNPADLLFLFTIN